MKEEGKKRQIDTRWCVKISGWGMGRREGTEEVRVMFPSEWKKRTRKDKMFGEVWRYLDGPFSKSATDSETSWEGEGCKGTWTSRKRLTSRAEVIAKCSVSDGTRTVTGCTSICYKVVQCITTFVDCCITLHDPHSKNSAPVREIKYTVPKSLIKTLRNS